MKELDDTWRLYRREWIVVHSLDMIQADDAKPIFDTAVAWIRDNLTGRVLDSEIDTVINAADGWFWGQILVFKDNLKGEFKHYGQAEAHARAEGYEEYAIVPRNSKSDHDIRSYGVKKL